MAAPSQSSSPAFADAYSRTSLVAFEQSFSDYLRFNKREQGPLIEDRGHKVRFALFKAFRDISPSAETIRHEAAARGWRLLRRPGADGEPLTPEREIRARIRSRRFLALSFILRDWKRPAEGRGQSGRFAARTRAATEIGSAIVRTAVGEESPRVALSSYLEGAVAQSRRRGIVATVLTEQAQDMAVYVRRKHAERLRDHFAREFRATLNVPA